MRKGGIKALVYEWMPASYAEASDGGRLPAPARDIGYAVRRLSGLGDRLDITSYFLKGGRRGGLLNQYLDDHPGADWDVVRDARGSFVSPLGTETPMGTIEVRDELSAIDGWKPPSLDGHERPPSIDLWYPTRGPGDEYGTVLYIEKEGKLEALNADRVAQRWDLGIVSCKGYSVHAARRFVRHLHDTYGVRVLVAHDFDKAGIGIFDTLGDGYEDIGLRWDDVVDERWNLDANSEPVSYQGDPRPNLQLRGATTDEIDFLVRGHHGGRTWTGRRIELNALVGRTFIEWLESRLAVLGVAKVIPSSETLEAAYRYAYARRLVNLRIAEVFSDASREAATVTPPADLVTRVTNALDERRERSWDTVIASLVTSEIGEDE
jgi:hypothetical protein